jgi:DNA-binding Lrp family transcriptional regulator
LPLCRRPFKALAEKIGIGEEELLAIISGFVENGTIRRFGARIKHHKAGYEGNVMTVWNVPEEEIDKTGEVMTSFPQVSHCYERPKIPDFPYNLYSMVHGHREEDCIRVIEKISEVTGIKDYNILVTSEEHKKIAPHYF